MVAPPERPRAGTKQRHLRGRQTAHRCGCEGATRTLATLYGGGGVWPCCLTLVGSTFLAPLLDLLLLRRVKYADINGMASVVVGVIAGTYI